MGITTLTPDLVMPKGLRLARRDRGWRLCAPLRASTLRDEHYSHVKDRNAVLQRRTGSRAYQHLRVLSPAAQHEGGVHHV